MFIPSCYFQAEYSAFCQRGYFLLLVFKNMLKQLNKWEAKLIPGSLLHTIQWRGLEDGVYFLNIAG